MAYTPTNWQDGVTPVNAVNMNKLEQGLAAAVGIPADVVVTPATAHLIRNRYNAADTQPAFRLLASGKMEFGLGGAAAPDVNLYRFGTTTLGIDGSLVVNPPAGDVDGGSILLDVAGGWAYPVLRGDGTGMAFSAGGVNNQADWEVYTANDVEGFTVFRKVAGTGPTGDLFRFTQGGIKFSAGGGLTGAAATAGFDTTLRRAGAGALQVDGNWYVNGSVFWTNAITDLEREPNSRAVEIYGAADTGASRMEIWGDGLIKWGPGVTTPMDTNLYRYAAGMLATDGQFYLRGASSYLAFFRATDANARFYIGPDGNHNWGPGNATQDTNLYRNGAGWLKTDGTLEVTGNIYHAAQIVNNSQPIYGFVLSTSEYGAAGPRLTLQNSGHIFWGPGTGATDTNLYRVGVANLRTDGALQSGGAFTAQGTIAATPTGAGAVAFSTAGTVPPATGYYLTFQGLGDTAWRFLMHGDGSMTWGSGSAAGDTRLYRSGVGVLQTDGEFVSLKNFTAHEGFFNWHAGSGNALTSHQQGHSSPQFVVGYTGTFYWGPGGSGALDTNLYRSAAGTLKTDGSLEVVGGYYSRAADWALIAHKAGDTNMRLGLYAGGSGIYFGPGNAAEDTNLSRYSPGVLAINGVPITSPVVMKKVTSKTIVNTTTITDLLNSEFVLPVLKPTSIIRLKAWGDWVQNSGANNNLPRFLLMLGGVVLLDTATMSTAASSSATRFAWGVEAHINNLNVVTSQSADIRGHVGHGSLAAGGAFSYFNSGEGKYGQISQMNRAMFDGGVTGAAVNTGVATLLQLQAQNGVASPGCDIRCFGAIVEIF